MKRIVYVVVAMLIVSCSAEVEFDAQGVFEAVEVVVSSEANGKIITFEVIASDAFGVIGRGTHQRAVINTEKFISKANQKLSKI